MKTTDRLSKTQTGLNRRHFLSGASTLAAAGWVIGTAGDWALSPAWASTDGPIKIGVGQDLTGGLAALGTGAWQVAQLWAEQKNAAGGILGRPIELHLEDFKSDPARAVSASRRLVGQKEVDVVMGGIFSSTREAIKNTIIGRGETLYIYPQQYEGGDCTEHLFVTGPVPDQQCALLIPYLMSQGAKRFAFIGQDYIWPRRLNEFARGVVEAEGGEVIFEEYFPFNHVEFSTLVSRVHNENIDCVFHSVVPTSLTPFTQQIYDSGFQREGGLLACTYYDEDMFGATPSETVEGIASCLDNYWSLDLPFNKKLWDAYYNRFADSKLWMGQTSTAQWRGMQLFEQAVIRSNGDLSLEALSAAMDGASTDEAPGGPAQIVPGTGHCQMNMYVGVNRGGTFEVVQSAEMMPSGQCG